MNLEELKSKWIDYEKKKIEERKKRRYLHFDSIISQVDSKILNEIFNPNFVSRRFFYPLIKEIKVFRRFKVKEGKKGVDKKERVIYYASHKDAFILSWYSFILSTIYEKKIKKLGISSNVIAYRSMGLNNIDFAKEVFDYIENKKNCTAVAVDIKGFFDNLSHKRIKSVWRDLLLDVNLLDNNNLPDDHYAIFRAITNYSYSEKKEIYDYFNIKKENIKNFNKICSHNEFKNQVRTAKLIYKKDEERGIPQGLATSAVLSNAYMLGFDVNVNEYIKKINGLYRRYSDDIIVVCDTKDYLKVKKFIEDEIKKMDLIINSEKTEIATFTTGLDGVVNCVDETGRKKRLKYLGAETDGVTVRLLDRTISRNDRKIKWHIQKEKRRAKKSKNNFSKSKIYKRFLHDENRSFKSYGIESAKKLGSNILIKQFSNSNIIRIIRKKIKKSD